MELESIGEKYLVRSKASGAVVVVEPDFLGLVRAVLRGAGPQELSIVAAHDLQLPEAEAGALVEEILGLWDQAGLFDAGTIPADHQRQRPAPGNSLHFAGGAGALTLHCADRRIEAQLVRLLDRFRVSAPPSGRVVSLVISTEGEGYVVTRDGRPLWDRCGQDAARYFALRTAAEVLCGGAETGAILHAGAVSGAAGAVIFTGTSGSGKSTTIGNLVVEGHQYLADDVLPVDTSGETMFSFPVPLGLKAGGGKLPALEALFRTALAQPSPRDGVSYVAFETDETPPKVPISALVLPRYDPAAEQRLNIIAPEHALRDILLAGVHFPQGTIAGLARLLSRVPVYRLVFGSTVFAMEKCREVLQCKPG